MAHNKENIEIVGEDDIKAAFIEVLDLCKAADNKEKRNKLIRAYNYAYEAHKGMKRKSGEPFIFHPIAVAKIVVQDIRLGCTSVISALLHDVVEDVEDITVEDIEKEFGKKVAYIVNGLTKVNKVEGNSSMQVATYRKVLMSLSEDLRVVLIKISDRLHNMRTLGEMSEKNKMVKTGETLDVYAPLARQLGLNKIGRELEDLSFEHYRPAEYKRLMEIIEKTKEKREAVIQNFRDRIKSPLSKAGINYEIKIIRKSLYATWQIMKNQHLDFEDVDNFQTLRLIFTPQTGKAERNQCYDVYVLMTELFNTRTGSMRDTIKNPLQNGFEALTVDLMLSDGSWKEIQILSNRMSEIAERGYSSEKKLGHEKELSVRAKWLLKIKDQLVKIEQTDEEFFDNFKLTLYTSEIYTYTPNGDMITLPKGATVLDFAFHIHSELGLHCVGAKVNKKMTNYTHVLESGDQVEILASESVSPKIDWLQYILSAKAKQTLNNYFKKQRKQTYKDGKGIYDSVLADSKITMDEVLLSKLLKYFSCDSINQLYAKIGENYITSMALSKAMKSMSQSSFIPGIIERIRNNKPLTETPKNGIEFNPKQYFVINDRTLNDFCIISECCLPIAGDSAIAHKNTDGTIHIHSTECQKSIKLRSQNKTSIATVRWNVSSKNYFKANIFVEGIDRKSLLYNLTTVISKEMLTNMNAVNIKRNNGIYKGYISLDVPNIDVLKTIINKLKKISGVKSLGRNKI